VALRLPGFLQRGAPPMLGVDIGSSRVKIVELGPGRDNALLLLAYAVEHVEERAIVEGNIENAEMVAAALTRALRRLDSRTRTAAIAMPASAVITKKITLPAGMTEDEYEAEVESEASQYIPFAIDEVNLDFEVLGPAPGGAEAVEVLIAASRKDRIEDRVAVAQMCGLQPTVMDIDSHAAMRAFEYVQTVSPSHEKGEVVAVFDVGHALTRTIVWCDGETLFEREQAFGGQQLAQELVRTYGMTDEEAEKAKLSGEVPGDARQTVVEPFIEQGAGNVARVLQVFFASTSKSQVDRILLTGGSCVVPGLAEAISRRVKVPVAILDTLQGIEIAGTINEARLRADAPSLLTAFGLAMRRFDP
jgi:type IV pilus assembly protein PilM